MRGRKRVTSISKRQYIESYLEDTCPLTKSLILNMIEQGTVRVTVERGVVKLHCSKEHAATLEAVVKAGVRTR